MWHLKIKNWNIIGVVFLVINNPSSSLAIRTSKWDETIRAPHVRIIFSNFITLKFKLSAQINPSISLLHSSLMSMTKPIPNSNNICSYLEKKFSVLDPNKDRNLEYNQSFQRITTAIKIRYPTATIEPYGSYGANVALSTRSDIDLCVTITTNNSRKMLNELRDVLEKACFKRVDVSSLFFFIVMFDLGFLCFSYLFVFWCCKPQSESILSIFVITLIFTNN